MNDGNTYNSTYNVTIGILGSIGGDTTPEYNSTYDVTIAILDYLQSHPIGGLPVEVVTELPETGEENKIYLVPSSDPETQDLFDEYLWINNAWEKVGGASIDLENYYTKEEIDEMLADKQDVIDDLEEIRENAASALQPEDIVDSLGPTDADKPISARAVNVDMVNYVDGSISDTILYIDQQDASEHDGRVAGDNLLSYAIAEVDEVTSYSLNDLNTRLEGKQNTLTAGTNITIVNDVISAVGGGEGLTLMDYDNIDEAIALDIFDEPEKYIIFKEMSALQTLYFKFSEVLNNYKNFCTINQVTDMGGDYDLHNNYVISIDYLGQKQFNTVQYKYYNTDEVDELIAGAGGIEIVNYNDIDTAKGLKIFANPEKYAIYKDNNIHIYEKIYQGRKQFVNITKVSYKSGLVSNPLYTPYYGIEINSNGGTHITYFSDIEWYSKGNTDTLLAAKQDTLTAGDGIDITSNVISSTVQYDYDSTTYTLNIITE